MSEEKNEVISSFMDGFITGTSERIDDIEIKLNKIATEQAELKKRIHIGSEVEGYVITAMTETSCMAERKYKKSAEDYVVWNIDRDKCGVNNGRYFDEKEDAVMNFASRLYRTRP